MWGRAPQRCPGIRNSPLSTVPTDGMIMSLVSHLIATALGEARAAIIPSHDRGDKAIPRGELVVGPELRALEALRGPAVPRSWQAPANTAWGQSLPVPVLLVTAWDACNTLVS